MTRCPTARTILSGMKLRNGYRRPAERLRRTVDALPRHSREAMLRGIESNRIIAGAYVDSSSGGVCPMLAAHRNGGRTDLSSFAHAWDIFTGARKARRATRREVAALRGYLEMSLIGEGDEYLTGHESIAEAAGRIRRERSAQRAAAVVADAVEASHERPPTGERDRGRELRGRRRWSWMRPTRRLDIYRERLAAASEEHAEQRAAAEVLDDRPPAQVEKAEGSPGPRVDDLGDQAVGRGAQQQPDRLGQILGLDHVLGVDLLADPLGHRRVDEPRAERRALDAVGADLGIWVAWLSPITPALVAE